jgi:hypothetical protein
VDGGVGVALDEVVDVAGLLELLLETRVDRAELLPFGAREALADRGPGAGVEALWPVPAPSASVSSGFEGAGSTADSIAGSRR